LSVSVGRARHRPLRRVRPDLAFAAGSDDPPARWRSPCYAEIHDDEKAVTATAVLRRATSWFAKRGVTTVRVLSDSGSAYRSHAWRDTCTELGITPKRTRPYRPQTNGKIERFHRTLADRWAFARHDLSEAERREALPGRLHEYNHHRPHTATRRQAPITRLTNVPGHHS